MIKGRAWRVGLMTAVVASASVYVPASFAAAAVPTNAQLARLVQQQAKQIQRLNDRINQLEGQGSGNTGAGRVENGASTSAVAARTTSPRESEPGTPSGAAASQAVAQSNPPTPANASLAERVTQLENHVPKVSWADGAPEFESANGADTFGIGGRIQYDFSSTQGSRYNGGNGVPSRNLTGSAFRRLRLDAHGKVDNWLLYKLEVDFVGDKVGLRDVYLAAEKNYALGQGAIYLGSVFADRGLDAYTSSKWTWFTERNTVANALEPAAGSYLTGVTGAFYGKDDWHVSLGVNKGGTNADDANYDDNLTVLSRAHWDPIATSNYILHVGVNGFYEDMNGNPNVNPSSYYDPSATIGGHYDGNLRIQSAAINAASGTEYGFELAGLAGPFAADAEYGREHLDGRFGGPNASFDAYSAQVGYSLTGEMFGYSTKTGTWTRPKIAHPVTQGGFGDWEVVARYEALDFENDAAFDGGTGHGTSVGLNWYLNKYARLLFDDSYWRTNNRHGNYALPDDGNSINARAQIVF